MGLDMHFYIRKAEYKTASGYESNGKDLVLELPERLKGKLELEAISRTTDYNIGYMRKANAIHAYIVDHFAAGRDNCQEIELGVDELKELKAVVDEVLADHSKASEKLPTRSGFFFGSTEYDEWYFKGLKYASGLFGKLLAAMPDELASGGMRLIYQASW